MLTRVWMWRLYGLKHLRALKTASISCTKYHLITKRNPDEWAYFSLIPRSVIHKTLYMSQAVSVCRRDVSHVTRLAHAHPKGSCGFACHAVIALFNFFTANKCFRLSLCLGFKSCRKLSTTNGRLEFSCTAINGFVLILEALFILFFVSSEEVGVVHVFHVDIPRINQS